jgi:D-alanyl-lipoteichoic acid acyltransferase DltB (MBOAT superfamily)
MQTSLLSVEFLATSFAAVLLLGWLRGSARSLSFLGLNLVFLWFVVLGPTGTISTLAFLLLGYGLTRAVQSKPKFGLHIAITIYATIFIYMRRYGLLDYFLPEILLTQVLATIGLSFLFFKVLHVLIEARSGTLGPIDFPTFVNYCLNFTTFMMGPIQRFQDYRAQWTGEKCAIPLTFEAHLDAVLRILFGMLKAYVLAVWFDERALQPDTDLAALNLTGWIMNVYCFWFYLYLNFSGYCDVVIGVGSLMGVRPPENFNKPFLATNASDFWLRQHRSLTLWLTDYVFSPCFKKGLEGRFAGQPLLAANLSLMVTMLVSGLWHGTTLAFLLFGLTHGLYLVIYRTWDTWLTRRWGKKRVRAWRTRWPAKAVGIALTFNATAFAFIFFRIETEVLTDLAVHWWTS